LSYLFHILARSTETLTSLITVEETNPWKMLNLYATLGDFVVIIGCMFSYFVGPTSMRHYIKSLCGHEPGSSNHFERVCGREAGSNNVFQKHARAAISSASAGRKQAGAAISSTSAATEPAPAAISALLPPRRQTEQPFLALHRSCNQPERPLRAPIVCRLLNYPQWAKQPPSSSKPKSLRKPPSSLEEHTYHTHVL